MKKILVVSDTHRKLTNLQRALEAEKGADLLIHLGDIEGDEEEIRRLAGCPVEMVKGNNDFFCALPREEEIWLAGHKAFLTHGHDYGVSVGNEILRDEARARGCDIVMYGHTHRPVLDENDGGLTVLNPGSLSYPRQMDRRPSYAVILAETGKNLSFELKELG